MRGWQLEHPEETCKNCGAIFKPHKHGHCYCSRKCKNQARGKRKCASYSSVNTGLSCSTVGTISELIAIQDLYLKGYEVFKTVSPASSCDLIALKEDKTLRIEVTTGRADAKNAKIHHSKTKKMLERCDHLALVVDQKLVIYRPPIND